MRIGIIAEPLNQPFTGIATYTSNLIQDHRNENENYDVFLINYENNFPREAGQNVIVMPYNSFFKKISKSYLWYLTLPFRIRKYKDFDLIHCLAQYPLVIPFNRPRYIITVHDLIQLLSPKEVPLGSYLIRRIFLPHTLKQADCIITDANSTKRDIIELFNIPDTKIEVIPLAADEKFYPRDDEHIRTIRSRYGLVNPFILYVGSMEPRKNIPSLIRAFLSIKQKGYPHDLVIAGKKSGKYKSIYNLIDSLNLSREVKLLGYVPDDDLPGLYSAAEVFVYPSFYEGFGLPPLEAMSCGCPVIAANTSSLPEVVGDAGILVNPRSVSEISNAISNVLEDRVLREKLKNRGLIRAQTFCWEKCITSTNRLYRDILSNDKGFREG